MLEKIKANFNECIQTHIVSTENISEKILEAATVMTAALLANGKILCCGNGNSAALAQQFATNMIHRFEIARPSLPTLALNSDNLNFAGACNDQMQQTLYAKQVCAFGQKNDIFLAISPLGNHLNIIEAVKAAVTSDMTIVALTGYEGGQLAGLLGPNDVEIRVPSQHIPRIEELHMFIVNCLCDLIDYILFVR